MGHSKKFNQKNHAKRRAFERFGIILNRDDLKAIVNMIQTSNGIHIRHVSHSRSTWAIKYAGHKLYVAYDKHTKTIATVMPLEYAVSDLLKSVNDNLYFYNHHKRITVENAIKIDDNVKLAYTLFKEITGENK